MLNQIIPLLFTIAFVSNTYANIKRVSFNAGLDTYYINSDTKQYQFDQTNILKNTQNYVRRGSVGMSIRLTPDGNYPIFLGIRTNRLVNYPITEYGFDTKSKQYVKQKVSIISDSISLGIPISNRNSAFISYAFISQKYSLEYASGKRFESTSMSNLTIVGMSHILNKHVSIFGAYIFPNKDLNIRYGVGGGINYTF